MASAFTGMMQLCREEGIWRCQRQSRCIIYGNALNSVAKPKSNEFFAESEIGATHIRSWNVGGANF
jgi:hypothetical protein